MSRWWSRRRGPQPAAVAGPLSSGPVSAAPGNETPSAPADPAAGDRRRPLFAAAVLVGLLVVAVGIWLMTRGGGDDDAQGTALAEAGPADPSSPTSTGSQPSEPSQQPSTTGGSTASTGGTGTPATVARDALLAVLISDSDVPGSATFREAVVTSGADGEHPLNDYHYCNQSLDLAQAGPGAKRILSTNFLSPDGVLSSTVSLLASPAAATAVVDQMVTSAGSCTRYTDNSGLLPADVTVLSVERTDAGAVITEQITSAASSVDLTVIVNQVGDVITTLEVTPATDDRVRLEPLLASRVADLPR